jgi:hypothetical protein
VKYQCTTLYVSHPTYLLELKGHGPWAMGHGGHGPWAMRSNLSVKFKNISPSAYPFAMEVK